MDEPFLERAVGDLLRERKLTLVTAESCTAGLLGYFITLAPGSSAYYLGGVVCYANDAKIALAGVNPQTLLEHGAVSAETALDMAQGIRRNLHGDIGLSVTGIAGPGGGSPDKPVGLTWIGLASASGTQAFRFVWNDGREKNRLESARAALQVLLDHLQGR